MSWWPPTLHLGVQIHLGTRPGTGIDRKWSIEFIGAPTSGFSCGSSMGVVSVSSLGVSINSTKMRWLTFWMNFQTTLWCQALMLVASRLDRPCLKCCHSERSCCVRHHTMFLDWPAIKPDPHDIGRWLWGCDWKRTKSRWVGYQLSCILYTICTCILYTIYIYKYVCVCVCYYVE